MAGDGNYGGNGSVYFENHVNGQPAGNGSDPSMQPHMFRLSLRYSTESGKSNPQLQGLLQAGISSMNAALTQLRNGSDDVTAHVEVPAFQRKTPPSGANPGWEVKIEW